MKVVEIKTDNVTLDLGGFTIQGPRALCFSRFVPIWCTMGVSSAAGIESYSSNTTVFNGIVRDMTGPGVWASGANSRIDRLTVTRNFNDGIVVGEGALVSNNIVTHNNASRACKSGRTSIIGRREPLTFAERHLRFQRLRCLRT